MPVLTEWLIAGHLMRWPAAREIETMTAQKNGSQTDPVVAAAEPGSVQAYKMPSNAFGAVT
jgi:hypothetical protein